MVIAEVGEEDLADLLPLIAAYCEFYGAAPGADSLLPLCRTLLDGLSRGGVCGLSAPGPTIPSARACSSAPPAARTATRWASRRSTGRGRRCAPAGSR